jgi:hypothetical protein
MAVTANGKKFHLHFQSTFFSTRTVTKSGVVVSYRLAISTRQNGPQRARGVSKQLPESRDSGTDGNFGAQLHKWDEANMGTKSHD